MASMNREGGGKGGHSCHSRQVPMAHPTAVLTAQHQKITSAGVRGTEDRRVYLGQLALAPVQGTLINKCK